VPEAPLALGGAFLLGNIAVGLLITLAALATPLRRPCGTTEDSPGARPV